MGQPATDCEIQQDEPEERERREDAGDENAQLMGQQEEKIVPADLLADVIGREPQPQDACRDAAGGDQSHLLFRWRHTPRYPHPRRGP